MKELTITDSMIGNIIICGFEYAEKYKAKILGNVKMGVDSCYGVQKLFTPRARKYRYVGMVSTDVAEIAVCEFNQDFFNKLCAEITHHHYISFFNMRLMDWEVGKKLRFFGD